MTQTYGFADDSWEAETTPLNEAFWQFKTSNKAYKSLILDQNVISIPNLE
jgi:hypothetical protein